MYKADSTKSGFFFVLRLSHLSDLCSTRDFMFKKVFIVDDEPIYTFILQQISSRVNFAETIEIRNSSKDAYEELSQTPDSEFPDCLIFDIQMPLLNGWELLSKLKEKKPDFKSEVILISSFFIESEKQKSMQDMNISRYLTKPVTPEDFKAILESKK
ncbi:response regulator [bacterium]|nr:MAG: response regulator [bacterium]